MGILRSHPSQTPTFANPTKETPRSPIPSNPSHLFTKPAQHPSEHPHGLDLSPNKGIPHQRTNPLPLPLPRRLHLRIQRGIDTLFAEFSDFCRAQSTDIIFGAGPRHGGGGGGGVTFFAQLAVAVVVAGYRDGVVACAVFPVASCCARCGGGAGGC